MAVAYSASWAPGCRAITRRRDAAVGLKENNTWRDAERWHTAAARLTLAPHVLRIFFAFAKF